MDSAAHRLYIATANGVVVVDTGKHKVEGVIPQPERVHCVALRPGKQIGYATLWQPNLVAVIDLKTLKTIDTIDVHTVFAKGQWPKAIVYEPTTERLFTFNESSGDCTCIDANTNKVLGHIPLGGIPGFAVADGEGLVYANVTQTNEVVAISANTMTIAKRWPVVWGLGPTGLAYDAKHGRLYSTCNNARLVVSDPVQGKALASVPIGKGADAVAYDPKTGLLFSSNGNDGTITVIQERGPNDYYVLTTTPSLWGARTMAIDERTHHLFVVAPTAPDTTGPYSGRGVLTMLELAPR
jgi:DNA-binding beta-propeller fold protein YncE